MEPCAANEEKAHRLLDKMNFFFVEWENPHVNISNFLSSALLTKYTGTEGPLPYAYLPETH